MSDPAPPAAPLGPANIGPDGENIVEMTYYETLGIRGDADAGTIKKAYRKQAIRFHPDKNPGNPEAAAKFHEVAEAYAVLSDGNLRAVYNKQGSSSAVAGAGGKEAMPDPGQMFSQLFGGKAFEDWIGEISLGKDVSKAFEMSTTEEERETMKADLVNADGTATSPAATATPQSTIHHAEFEAPPTPASAPPTTTFTPAEPFSAKGQPTTSTSLGSATSPPPSVAGPAPVVEDKPDLASSRKMTPEQREKLQLYDKERVEEKRERLRMLASKLRDRIRPFVEASKPGDAEDPETKRYADRIRQEAADLAMESFGVEICNLIGEIYMQKASSYIKLHRKASSNILGIPKFFAGLKQSVQTVKEGWSFLSVGLDVQSAMADMERRQTKGEELGEEEMKQMEADLSGKLLLVAWKGSKFELSTILRTVVDTVLTKEEADVTDATLMNRAKAILLTGAILRSVTPDETDTERRQLETLVLEANRKRKEKGGKGKKAVTVPTP